MQGDAWWLRALAVLAVALSGCPAWSQDDGAHLVPMFPGAGDGVWQGFVRVINHSRRDGEVRIQPFDDGGVPFGPITLAIHARETVHFNSTDPAEGNAAKGLSGGVGSGGGDWRLTLSSDLDIEVLSYVRTPADGGVHDVPLFPAASDPSGRQGFVRVINRSAESGEVTIYAFDDTDRDFGTSRLVLDGNETVHFNSDDLEMGNPGKGLTGGTGAGAGDWRLELTSDLDIAVLAYIRHT